MLYVVEKLPHHCWYENDNEDLNLENIILTEVKEYIFTYLGVFFNKNINDHREITITINEERDIVKTINMVQQKEDNRNSISQNI